MQTLTRSRNGHGTPFDARSNGQEKWLALLEGRSIYHAAPLHYLPSILSAWTLMAASISGAFGIVPRKTAFRRDRMLGVNGYVHLAFDLLTPLVRDKLSRGMPHVVLEFDAELVARNNLNSCALLPCNTKAWRSKAACQPVFDYDEMCALIKRRDEFGRLPSLEFLVKDSLDLSALKTIRVSSDRDAEIASLLIAKFQIRSASVNIIATNANIESKTYRDLDTYSYLDRLISAGDCALPLVPPSGIAFD